MGTAKILEKNNSVILAIIKGSFWGVAFSLICILIFAFILKYTIISETVIQPVNQVIKGLSLLVACYFTSRTVHKNGWLVGLSVGLLYTVLTYLIFSILEGNFVFGLSLLNDIVFGSIGGAIAGIICISLLRK